MRSGTEKAVGGSDYKMLPLFATGGSRTNHNNIVGTTIIIKIRSDIVSFNLNLYIINNFSHDIKIKNPLDTNNEAIAY